MILNDLTTLFEGFGIPKMILLGYLFGKICCCISKPSSGGLLAHFAPQGADLSASCRFWVILGNPLGTKIRPWSAQGGPKGPNRVCVSPGWRVPFAFWSRPVSQRGPERHFYRFWEPIREPILKAFWVPRAKILCFSRACFQVTFCTDC